MWERVMVRVRTRARTRRGRAMARARVMREGEGNGRWQGQRCHIASLWLSHCCVNPTITIWERARARASCRG